MGKEGGTLICNGVMIQVGRKIYVLEDVRALRLAYLYMA